MKKILLSVLAFTFATGVYAQTTSPKMEDKKSGDMKMEKKMDDGKMGDKSSEGKMMHKKKMGKSKMKEDKKMDGVKKTDGGKM